MLWNPAPFERLRERLLRGGVAPRAARRYLRELREHFDDLLREELAAGAPRAAAERSAWTRLGGEDELLHSALARPELRALGARLPAAVYGAGPLGLWIGAVALALAVTAAGAAAAPAGGGLPAGFLAFADALCTLSARVLPVGISVAALAAAYRQRLDPRWPLLGAAIVALSAGTLHIEVTAHQLALGSSLLPLLLAGAAPDLGPLDLAELARGLTRAAGMLATSALPYLALRARQRRVQV